MRRILCLLSVAGALSAACSGESSKKTPSTGNGEMKGYCDLPVACQEIAQACHPKDLGTPGTVHDCHLAGMVRGDATECGQKHDACIQACTDAPSLGGTPEDLSAQCRDGGLGTDGGMKMDGG